MNIISFEKLESTHAYAKQNIDLLEDKTIISTDIQTNGYGRFERKWVDLGRENIYMTFALKPSDKMSDIYANLTQYLSVCLCKQLEEMTSHSYPFTLHPSPFTLKIKWPNDVLINGKKVSGILGETVVKSGKLKGIILSIGVNLNASENDLKKIDRPTTSVNLELGQPVNKQEFMQKLVENFFVNYDEFLEKGFVLIKKDYEKRSVFKEKGKGGKVKENIKITIFNSTKEGFFNGFDDNGNLILLMFGGKTEKISMGEIVYHF